MTPWIFNNNLRQWLALIILAFCTLVVSAHVQAQSSEKASVPSLALHKAHQSGLAIYTTKTSQAAADALAHYLKQITSLTFQVHVTDKPPQNNAIVVREFVAQDTADLQADSFELRVDPTRSLIQIIGSNPRATRQAVYDFLETQAGCRWWSWNEEETPTNPDIAFPALNKTVKAPFRQTDIRNNEAYEEKTGFNYKVKSVSTEKQTRSHGMYAHLETYGKSNPDIYPLIKKTGKRAPNKIHHCYTAPGLAEVLAKAIEADFKKWPDRQQTIYLSCMGDAYGGYCECPACTSIYEEEAWTRPDGTKQPAYSATLLRLINETAKILDEKYPGIRIGTSAYMTLEGPPAKTVPAHNVHIRIPHLRHCILHAVDECAKNRRYFTNLQRWCELAPGRVYVWDYTVNFGDNFLYPLPNIRSMGNSIKLYHKLGVAGMTLQGNYVSTGGDMVVLKNYVYRKLLWDPSLDIDQLIDTFCHGYYGPAAEPMIQYVKLLEDGPVKSPGKHADEFAEPSDIRQTYLPPELIPKLQEALANAKKLATDKPPFDRRVAEASVSVEAWLLNHESLFAKTEQGLAKISKNGPVYTYDRAANLVENSRKASFREWGGHFKYQMPFLAQQGGPLVKLKQGALTVEVAPALGMRIWQISYKDKPLLRTPLNIHEPGFPQVGGAWVHGSPGVIHGQVMSQVMPATQAAQTPTPAPGSTQPRVQMLGAHHSDTTIKATSQKSVEIDPQGKIQISLSSQTSSLRTSFTSAGGTANLEFGFDRKLGLPKVQIDSGSGWVDVELPKPSPVSKKQKPNDPGIQPVELNVGQSVSAIRVLLPGSDVWVEDRLNPTPADPGKPPGPAFIFADTRAGYLKTQLASARTAINEKTMTQWLSRTISVIPTSGQ